MKYPKKIGNIFKLSFEEEVGNSVSHGVMAIFLLFFLPIASVLGYKKHGAPLAAGYSIYIIGIFLMFLMSTLYHSMLFNSAQKKVFRILDHCGIYLAIAGSITPVCIVTLDTIYMWAMLITHWSLVIIGIIYNSFVTNKKSKGGLWIYLIMGWSSVLLVPTLIRTQSVWFLSLIVLGGLLYSAGTYFYSKKDKQWHHFIWHLFVNAASISHFIAIIFVLK